MTVHTPHYYTAFRCLAGACPHTCCAGWEVPIDPVTADYYRTLPGPLGEELRAALEETAPGEFSFKLRGERCPFLNEQSLCRVHLALGEEHTGMICRTHPRFSYDYGPLNEKGLCGSCPEAARLILGSDLTILTAGDDRPGEEAPPLLSPLLTARGTALGLLEVEEATLSEQLQAVLLFANEVQVLLDNGREADIPELCEIYAEAFPLPDPAALPPRGEALQDCLEVLSSLDILRPEWRALLTAGRDSAALPPATEGKRAASYFLYRHWLRGVWDGDLLTWAEFAALGTAVCGALAPLHPEGFPGAFRQFCEEVEHSENNLAALQDALRDTLTLPQLLGSWGS